MTVIHFRHGIDPTRRPDRVRTPGGPGPSAELEDAS